MLIKICGITTPDMAYKAARAGANFIGLVCVPTSPRAVEIHDMPALAMAARAGSATPVAVFTETSAAKIQDICQEADIRWVQLHGQRAGAEQHLLPAHLHRIYAHAVSPQGAYTREDAVDTLDVKRDYLLFDAMHAGSGKPFDWSGFSYTGHFPWFLSGGLHADNVQEAIQRLHPTGVDVSSGVENTPGEKSYDKIVQFIEAVRLAAKE